MKMKYIALSGLSLIVLGACGPSESTDEKTLVVDNVSASVEQIADARLAAVMVYADWCGSCKVLDPRINAIRENNQFDQTAFITLDYTSKNKEAFYAAAQAYGVDNAVKDYLGQKVKTGQLLLVDLDDKRVVSVIKKDMDDQDIIFMIKDEAEKA